MSSNHGVNEANIVVIVGDANVVHTGSNPRERHSGQAVQVAVKTILKVLPLIAFAGNIPLWGAVLTGPHPPFPETGAGRESYSHTPPTSWNRLSTRIPAKRAGFGVLAGKARAPDRK